MTSSFSTVSTEGFSSDPTSSSRARRESFMRTNRASVFQNNWKDSIDQVVEEESMGGTAFRTGQRHVKDPNLLLTGTEQRRSSALESFVRRLTFDELSLNSSLQGRTSGFNNTGMSAFDSTRSDSTTPPPTTDGSRFKTTAHSIRQSLAVLINTRAGSGLQGMPNLCSGTINGRGSFMTEHAVERQLRFQMYDCLERVLQDSTRIRRLYDFMKRQQCPELLEFWSIVELYQNFYWKPFKLMGINLNIQVKRSPEELDEEAEEDETKESTKAPAKKKRGGQQLISEKEKEKEKNKNKDKGSLIRHTTLAKTLAKFTLEQEETLRGEIIYYYIEDEAPLQICLPSQMREKTLKTAARASELPDEDRLSMVSNFLVVGACSSLFVVWKKSGSLSLCSLLSYFFDDLHLYLSYCCDSFVRHKSFVTMSSSVFTCQSFSSTNKKM